MENKFNFNSQVCTDKNQSERLLALGLKPETADFPIWGTEKLLYMGWSLHRLICMLPEEIVTNGYSYNLCIDNNSICHFEYSACTYEHFVRCENLYDAIVGYIEWLIKEGYFNKEYLV